MACARCKNPKWDGPYPNCNDCITCLACHGSGNIVVKSEVKTCQLCTGAGWAAKHKVHAANLRANLVGVKLPMTVSLQFLDAAIMLTDVKGGAADLKKQPFLATITWAGCVSDGCVGGTESITDENGNVIGPLRIFIPSALMETKVTELIGKSVFAAESLDTHENSVDVGQFLDAYTQRMRGSEVYCVQGSGFFDKTKNETLVARIIERARSGELGFSYDLKDTPGYIDAEMNPGENIFVLTDFKWRGATVLYRNTAAYYFTTLAAKRADRTPAFAARTNSAKPSIPPERNGTDSTRDGQPSGDTEMTKEEIIAAVTAAMAPLSAEVGKLTAGQQALEARFVTLEAATKPAVTAPAKEEVLTAAGLSTAIATATAAAVAAEIGKALPIALAAAGIEKKPAPGTGQRATFQASEIATVERWGGKTALDETGEPTLDGLTATIHAINDNVTLTAEGRTRALDVIVPMRNQLQRELMMGGN